MSKLYITKSLIELQNNVIYWWKLDAQCNLKWLKRSGIEPFGSLFTSSGIDFWRKIIILWLNQPASQTYCWNCPLVNVKKVLDQMVNIIWIRVHCTCDSKSFALISMRIPNVIHKYCSSIVLNSAIQRPNTIKHPNESIAFLFSSL